MDFKNNKLNTIKDYFTCNEKMFDYLCSYDEKTKRYTSNKLTGAFKMGCEISLISNIFLAIKDDLIEKDEHSNFNNKVINESLERTASIISKKKDDGYYINDVRFNSTSEIVNMFRNKFAHGEFYIDFNKAVVAFNDSNKQFEISLYKILLFINSALLNYLIEDISVSNNADFVMTNMKNIDLNRKYRKIIKDIIKNTTYINIEVSAKPGCNVNEEDKALLLSLKNTVFKNITNGIALKDIIRLCVENNGSNIKIETKRPNEKDTKDIANVIVNNIDEDTFFNNYEYVVKEIGLQVLCHNNPSYKLTNIIKGYNDIYKILNDDKHIMPNEWIMTASILSMFNSLFIYPLDDIYLDNNDEFDFSKLDLSNIKPDIIDLSNNVIIEIENKIKRTAKDLKSKQGKLDSIDKILKNNKNANKEAIENTKQAIENDIKNLESEISDLDYKKSNMLNDNKTKNYNKILINKIRNSISHGNYELIPGNSLFEHKLVFKDVYKGVTNFSLTVSLKDMMYLISSSKPYVFDYIDKSIGKAGVKFADSEKTHKKGFEKIKNKIKSYKKKK